MTMAMSELSEISTAGPSRMGDRGRGVARSASSLTCEGRGRDVTTGPSLENATVELVQLPDGVSVPDSDLLGGGDVMEARDLLYWVV